MKTLWFWTNCVGLIFKGGLVQTTPNNPVASPLSINVRVPHFLQRKVCKIFSNDTNPNTNSKRPSQRLT